MRRIYVFIAGVVLLATPVLADTPVADLYAGYSVLNDSDLEETFTKGFVLSVAFSVSDTVAVPVEFSWHSKDLDAFGETVAKVSVKTYMGGLRFGRTFYAQVLAGAATADGEVFGFGADSQTEFAIQPGIGFDIKVGETVGIRLGGDYRRIFSDPGTNEWRGHIGLVFYLGSR